ncbi:MAG: DUF6496 domain-containing protein [Bacteroidota bacterium]
MAKYSKKAQEKVEKTMHERKQGTLKSSSGDKVTSKKQAIAIGLSEAREAGAKVPEKKENSNKSAKKAGPKKTAAKKATTKKAPAKKSAVKKSAPKKSAAKKSTKKSSSKK